MRCDFYKITKSSSDELLCMLVNKIMRASKENVALIIKDDKENERINNKLWEYKHSGKDTFIPHGNKNDGNAKMQPVYLLSLDEYKENNQELPNNAKYIVFCNTIYGNIPDTDKCERCFILFNGLNPMETENARNLWIKAKKNAEQLFYWQEKQNGDWEAKEY